MVKDVKNIQKYIITVLLHNIRSVHNVGSIFRTSNALGVRNIYISGFSPMPVDRFGRLRSDFSKVSLGSENSLNWRYFKSAKTAISNFKREYPNGYIIIVEQNPKSIPYNMIKIPKGREILIIMGNEVGGVDKELLNIADVIAEIPQYGNKESLNVSVAFAIAAFGIFSN